VSTPNAICQTTLPVAPWMDALAARLPGLQPVAAGDWLRVDDAYAAQMAYRDRLLEERRDEVVMRAAGPVEAEAVLLEQVIAAVLALPGFARVEGGIRRPDGVVVEPGREDSAIIAAARLAQEDFLILEQTSEGHVLTSAVLCFPASWSLHQKIGRNMLRIHEPVHRYDDNLAKRVNRVMDVLQQDNAVWRANVLCYNDPELHQPKLEHERRAFDPAGPAWVRVERQTLKRLTETATVFAIHTYVVPLEKLSPEQLASLPDNVRRGGSMGETN
jgi:dimethylamine monooxygenase subunit A